MYSQRFVGLIVSHHETGSQYRFHQHDLRRPEIRVTTLSSSSAFSRFSDRDTSCDRSTVLLISPLAAPILLTLNGVFKRLLAFFLLSRV